MPMLRIRITGEDDTVRGIMNLLQSLDGIEHVEEIADLMPHMDDDDSSSADARRRGGQNSAPLTCTTVSAPGSTPSRQRTLTATVGLPCGSVPSLKGAIPQVAQK